MKPLYSAALGLRLAAARAAQAFDRMAAAMAVAKMNAPDYHPPTPWMMEYNRPWWRVI